MERKPPKLLKLGDPLEGTILKSNGGRRFLVRCNAVPNGWKVELHTRRPELIKVGANASFWVAKIAPLQGEVLVHDGDYGRLPISEAMRPRYLAGLRAILGEAEATGEALAEARSMVAKVGKQQQADWLTVWRLLDEPAPGTLNRLLAAIDALRAARKESPESMPELHASLVEEFGLALRSAAAQLERSPNQEP